MKGKSEETSIENKGREWLLTTPVKLHTLQSMTRSFEGQLGG